MSVDDYIPDWVEDRSPTEVNEQPMAPAWREALLAALFAGVVVGTVVLLANEPVRFVPALPPAENDEDELVPSPDELAAAIRLGVDIDASADVVRAALRERIAASGIHPDQGGAHDEAAALIAAKNLLCERARRRARDDESRSTNVERT